MRPWPSYDNFEDSKCFNCKKVLSSPFQTSGLPHGHGEWKGQCTGKNSCGMITWFDLKK